MRPHLPASSVHTLPPVPGGWMGAGSLASDWLSCSLCSIDAFHHLDLRQLVVKH